MKQIIFSNETGRITGVSFAGFFLSDLPENHSALLIKDHVEIDPSIHAVSPEGEIIEVAPETIKYPVPAEVSRFQARTALLQTGYLEDIEAYMANPETDPFVRIAWQDAQVFRRHSPTVLVLQPILGITDEQLDDLFRFAATIEE
jgi:hypothetical protein